MNQDFISEENFEISETNKYININTRTIFIHGAITDEMALEVAYNIKEIDNQEGNITVNINSSGGAFDATISIISELYSCKNHVITNITGCAHSGAALVALCGDTRLMSNFGSFMLHYPIVSLEDRVHDVTKYTEITKENYARALKILLKDTKLTMKQYEKKKNTDWYLTPQEAKTLQLIQETY